MSGKTATVGLIIVVTHRTEKAFFHCHAIPMLYHLINVRSNIQKGHTYSKHCVWRLPTLPQIWLCKRLKSYISSINWDIPIHNLSCKPVNCTKGLIPKLVWVLQVCYLFLCGLRLQRISPVRSLCSSSFSADVLHCCRRSRNCDYACINFLCALMQLPVSCT